MTTTDQRSEGQPTTLIVGQEIEPGREAEFGAWLARTHSSAARFAGYLAADSNPPRGSRKEWVSIYRFESTADLRAWLNSRERSQLVNQVKDMLVGPPTQQVIPGDADGQADELVTVVVTHRVPPESEAEFLQWQSRMTEAEKKYDGFVGAELFKPITDVQEEWTAVYRFESGEDLEQWLESPERRQLLKEGERFQEFHLRAIQAPFGNWFARADRGPGAFRTSIAVYVGLYPTVVFLNLFVNWLLPDAAIWVRVLVGTLLSAFIMTLVTMPYYVNPLLKFWLTADGNVPQPKTTLLGLGISIATLTAWSLLFWLIVT